MRQGLSGKARALLVAGTLCVSAGSVWFAVGADSRLAHLGCGFLFGLGVTLNVGSWFMPRRTG